MKCPHCGSEDTSKYGKIKLFFGGISFIFLSLIVGIIPILGWIVAPFIFLSGVLVALGAPFMKPRMRCNNCRATWRADGKKEKRFGLFGEELEYRKFF